MSVPIFALWKESELFVSFVHFASPRSTFSKVRPAKVPGLPGISITEFEPNSRMPYDSPEVI